MNAESSASHKDTVQQGLSMFRAISDTAGNSVLIPSYNHLSLNSGHLLTTAIPVE